MRYLCATVVFATLYSALACGEITAPLWEETAAAATRHGLEPELLASLVWQESRYCADAVSPAGAIGLGQLMPDTADGLGVDPWQPTENLDGAARYLRAQLDTFGSLELALAAYNAGPVAVEEYSGIPPYRETQDYVPAVLAFYNDFKRQRGVTVEEDVAAEAVIDPTEELIELAPPSLLLYQRGISEASQPGNDLLLYSRAASANEADNDEQMSGGSEAPD